MPLITESHDSLPYIEPTPSPSSLAAAHALIASSLSPDAKTTIHPLLPSPPTPNFSPFITAELSRIASSTPLTAIDLSRYEASSTLPPSSSSSTPSKQKEAAKAALQAACTNSEYLTLRLQALELLEGFGKNAWLVGNGQLEDVLRGVERELVGTREAVEAVNRGRKGEQEGGRAELEGGERGWREGVGRVLEVMVGVGEVEGEWRGVLRGDG